MDAESTAALAVPPGRIVDLVTAWCARAADGGAGELRLFVRDGGIAVEERFAKPRALYQEPCRGGHYGGGGPRRSVATPEIQRLAALGWSAPEIVTEGAKRRAAGTGGWHSSSVYRALNPPAPRPRRARMPERRPARAPDDDGDRPDYVVKPAVRPRLEGYRELQAIMESRPGVLYTLADDVLAVTAAEEPD